MSMDRTALIEQRLNTALAPQELEIIDDSTAHAGHPGARGGGGHFNVRIISRAFVGKSPLQRHRMVYAAVEDLIPQEIHAFSIKALSPTEISSNR